MGIIERLKWNICTSKKHFSLQTTISNYQVTKIAKRKQ